MPVKALSGILLLLALAALVLGWGSGHPLLQAVLQPLRTGAAPALPVATGAVRKCVGAAGVQYTNEACPAGSREQPLDGGSLSVLPAAPVQASAAVQGAGSAVSPLRRLSGPAVPDLQQRQVDQALGR